ncbi:MAG: ComF family protein [Fusobacteriaceae bacterium]|nr:ComF family protein [Fusobacteriaceae bacterium]
MRHNPIKLTGDWNEGYALDYNAKKITYTGTNIFGYPKLIYDYTEIGKLLYEMKEFDDDDKCVRLAEIMADFIKNHWGIRDRIDGIIVAPTSTDMPNSPLYKLAKRIGSLVDRPVSLHFFAKLSVREIKALDTEEKMDIFKNNMKKMKKLQTRGNILILDDFYNTGTTMRSIAGLMREDINLDALYVLTAVLNKKID